MHVFTRVKFPANSQKTFIFSTFPSNFLWHFLDFSDTAIALHIQKLTRDPEFLARLEAEVTLISQGDSVDEYIEECINKQEPLVKILRLLCLSSLVNNGLKVKQLEFWKRELVQVRFLGNLYDFSIFYMDFLDRIAKKTLKMKEKLIKKEEKLYNSEHKKILTNTELRLRAHFDSRKFG